MKKTDAHAPGADSKSGGVIYQIYPRSFRDSNGDGVGDLPGVIAGLDYVASLGVDGVWLSPFFTSPMRDFGYDVSNYLDVDPVFGALHDFDRLIEKAHSLNLKVIIDQVYSHTSDQHAWFAESRSCRSNAKADWYVWTDPNPDGTPPNNWLSVFGGGAWEWDARRRQYYLHNFLASQPDLNLHDKAVQDALLEAGRFWLDRGVDGFRLDAINFAMHDPELRDNPPAPYGDTPPSRPFDYQLHIHNQSHPDIPKFLERLRRLTDNYAGIFTVAEIVGPDAIGEMKRFTENDKRLSSAYSFDFLYAPRLTPSRVVKSLSEWTGAAGEASPSWAFSNHDAPRVASRWADEKNRERAARLYAMLLLCLRGNVFLYQGEELGLSQANVAFEDLVDPEAIANWPSTLGRDGARTPMPWKMGAPNAGFSTAKPWLPVDPRHDALAVDAQERDQQSMLHFTRRMIALRKSSDALNRGDISFLDAPADILVFRRKHGEEEMLCVFNLALKAAGHKPSGYEKFRLVESTEPQSEPRGLLETLAPLSGYITAK